MQRRALLALPLACAAAACAALPAPSYKVSQAQLQAALAQRFPRRYPVGGMLEFQLGAPTLQLIPERNRLGALFALQADGPALQHGYTGGIGVEFGLRYEASDRSIRAHQLALQSLSLPGLSPRAASLLESFAPTLVKESMAEVVLHTLRPQDLAVADAMGVQPQAILVTPQGLDIRFAPAAK